MLRAKALSPKLCLRPGASWSGHPRRCPPPVEPQAVSARRRAVAALRQALPHLAPHEVIWRYYWMGGSLMVALAVPSGTIEAPDDDDEPAPLSRHGTMSANLIAFLVHSMRAPAGHAAAWRDGGATTASQCDPAAGSDPEILTDLPDRVPS